MKLFLEISPSEAPDSPCLYNIRTDYVWIEDAGPYSEGSKYHNYKFHVWENTGSGATKLKG